MFIAIVTALTLVVIAFVAVWLVNPAFRQWIERPKFRMLDQERRFENDRLDRIQDRRSDEEAGGF